MSKESAIKLIEDWQKTFPTGKHGHTFTIKHFMILLDAIMKHLKEAE